MQNRLIIHALYIKNLIFIRQINIENFLKHDLYLSLTRTLPATIIDIRLIDS